MTHALTMLWRFRRSAECRAAWSLLGRGFLWRREPSFVREGKKPDFFAFGRGRLWVEVKSFDPPASQTLLSLAWSDLQRRLRNAHRPIRVDAQVSGAYSQRAAKIALCIADRELQRVSDGEVFYVGIPCDVEKPSAIVTLEWPSRSGPVRMLVPRSISRKYGYPRWATPLDWSAYVTIREGQTVRRERTYKVLHESEPCVLTLRVERRPNHYGLAGVSKAEADEDTTVAKMRERIEDAASQLRNAQAYLNAPGVVVIYNDHLGSGHLDLFRACLGDITIGIDRATLIAGAPYFGDDGVMRPHKNTSVSAVTYCWRGCRPVSLLNPYAALPVPARWLAGIVYEVVVSTGEVAIVRGRGISRSVLR